MCIVLPIEKKVLTNLNYTLDRTGDLARLVAIQESLLELTKQFTTTIEVSPGGRSETEKLGDHRAVSAVL